MKTTQNFDIIILATRRKRKEGQRNEKNDHFSDELSLEVWWLEW